MSGRRPATSSAISASRHRRHRDGARPLDSSDLVTALGLVLVIEGVLLALFPERLARMTVLLLQAPGDRLRWGGITAAMLGLLVVWLVRH